MADLTIGADPELTIVYTNLNGNHEIRAIDIVADDNRTKVFGCDGHSSTLELRPKPQTDPKLLTLEIGKILKRHQRSLLGFKLTVNQQYAPVGGHIHFGHTWLLTENNRRILTNNLACLLAPLIEKLETQEAYSKRRNNGYGSKNDSRLKDFGLEYRALSSFIVTPRITDSIFCLAYAIASATIFDSLVTPIPDTESHQIIKSLKLYRKYRKEIEYIYTLIANNKKISNMDIKKGWGLYYPTTKKPSIESIAKIYPELLKNINLTDPKIKLHINYNPNDIEIPQIATRCNYVISKLYPRMKPRNNFYIYGLAFPNPRILLKLPYSTKLASIKLCETPSHLRIGYSDVPTQICLDYANIKRLKMGLPLSLRLHPSYTAEAYILYCFLIFNHDYLSLGEIDKNNIYLNSIFDHSKTKNTQKIAMNERYYRDLTKFVMGNYKLKMPPIDLTNPFYGYQTIPERR